MGTANAMPWPPRITAVLTPTTSPALVNAAARVAGVEGGIGLDQVLETPHRPRPERAAQGAHHAGCHRVLKAERIADGNHDLTRPQA